MQEAMKNENLVHILRTMKPTATPFFDSIFLAAATEIERLREQLREYEKNGK